MSVWACGFDSRQPHQTNIIRTYFQSVMGSDYCFSLTVTKASISATGYGAGPPPSREAHGKGKRLNNQKERRRYREVIPPPPVIQRDALYWIIRIRNGFNIVHACTGAFEKAWIKNC